MHSLLYSRSLQYDKSMNKSSSMIDAFFSLVFRQVATLRLVVLPDEGHWFEPRPKSSQTKEATNFDRQIKSVAEASRWRDHLELRILVFRVRSRLSEHQGAHSCVRSCSLASRGDALPFAERQLELGRMRLIDVQVRLHVDQSDGPGCCK